MTALLLKVDLSFLQHKAWGNTAADYLWFIVLVAAAFFLVKPLTAGCARLGSALAGRFSAREHGATFRSMIMRPLGRLLQCILLFAAVNQLGKPFNITLVRRSASKGLGTVRLIDLIDHLFIFFLILFTTLLISSILDFIFRIRIEKAGEAGQKDKLQIFPLLREVVKLLLWATCFFTIMGTVLHVNVPALITGLGIGGVAIALAGKETVENLFASFTILVDKPFRMGDAVKLGSIEGTAEKIGFRSTRLRSGDGSIYIIPNKKLIDDNLENLSERAVRRVRVPVMIKYGLSHGDLTAMSGELAQMLRKHPSVRKPTEILLDGFGENALQLMITYYLPHPLKADTLAGIKQEIAMRIFEIVSRYSVTSPITVQLNRVSDLNLPPRTEDIDTDGQV